MVNYGVKKVIIFLSTFNGAKFLEEQLKSIAEQKTSSYVELLLRDDGSNDSTKEIISKWKDKLHINILKDNEHLGPALSFWKLVQKAEKADVYMYADQDDIWDKDKVEEAVRHLCGLNTPVLYGCGSRICNVAGKDESSNGNSSPVLTIESQLICGSIPGCAMAFNYFLLKKLRKDNITCIPMHDTITLLYALAHGKVIYDSTPRFSRRMHGDNVVGRINKKFAKVFIDRYNLWINTKRLYPKQLIVQELLENCGDLFCAEDYMYLKKLEGYRSIFNKFYILTNKKTTSSSKRGLAAYSGQTA